MKVSRGDSLDRFYLLKAFGWGVFVHRIHHTDPVGLYHSHPWSGLSIILGGYNEVFRSNPNRVHRRRWFNLLKANRHHRVIIDRPVWTLFIHAPKSNQWEIVDGQDGKVAAPWEGDKGHKSYTAALGQV